MSSLQIVKTARSSLLRQALVITGSVFCVWSMETRTLMWVTNLFGLSITHVRMSLSHLWHACLFQEGGRLLYIGQNEWTHVNCALWSAEVFEDDDGSLKNVHMAVLRGKQLVRHFVHHQFPLYFQCIFIGQTFTTCCTLYSALWEVSKARGHSWLLPHLLHQ